MNINERMFDFMSMNSPQKDQCKISLIGSFVEMFLMMFNVSDFIESEDYVYDGVRHLEVTGYMRGDWFQLEQWIISNKVTAELTQGFMDSNYDYYLCESFEAGEYKDYNMDIYCHSQDDEAVAALEGI